MLAPILACLFNCAPTVVVSVEAHGKSAPAAGTQVVLRPYDPRVALNDPTYQYLVKVVSRALAQKGLQLVQTEGDGHSVVLIEWRADGPKAVTQALQYPVTEGFRASPRGAPAEVYGIGGGPAQMATMTARDGNPGGLGPDELNTRKVTRYPWTIALRGLDPAAAGAPPLWTVTASSDSASEDPADIAPEIIAASLPLIGADRPRQTVRLSASDAAVKAIAPPRDSN